MFNHLLTGYLRVEKNRFVKTFKDVKYAYIIIIMLIRWFSNLSPSNDNFNEIMLSHIDWLWTYLVISFSTSNALSKYLT